MNQRIKERLQDKLRKRVERSISSEQPPEDLTVETPSTAHLVSSNDLSSNNSSRSFLIFRAVLASEDDAEIWLRDYENVTKTHWNSRRTYPIKRTL